VGCKIFGLLSLQKEVNKHNCRASRSRKHLRGRFYLHSGGDYIAKLNVKAAGRVLAANIPSEQAEEAAAVYRADRHPAMNRCREA
jgi:hypothetical protein